MNEISPVRVPVIIDIVVNLHVEENSQSIRVDADMDLPARNTMAAAAIDNFGETVVEKLSKPKQKAEYIPPDGFFKCSIPGCNQKFDSRRGLGIHMSYHDPERKRRTAHVDGTADFSSGDGAEDFGKEVSILNCANPRCIRKHKFVKNTGFIDPIDGSEYCCKRCYEESEK